MNCCNHSDHQEDSNNNQKNVKDGKFSLANLGHALHWIIMIGIGIYILAQFIVK